MSKCPDCGGEYFEDGEVHVPGLGRVMIVPRYLGWFRKAMGVGAPVRARACRQCGRLEQYVDPQKLKKIADDGETRCRKCRQILRGITTPVCPECGEAI